MLLLFGLWVRVKEHFICCFCQYDYGQDGFSPMEEKKKNAESKTIIIFLFIFGFLIYTMY